MQYISNESGGQRKGCVFCASLAEGDDEQALIVWRGRETFAILNAYPYNTGHLLLLPTAHIGGLEEMGSHGRTELFETAHKATDLIADAMGAEGFNLGMNLGAAAGAGIPGHLHLHVVPRWSGDTNFMPVTGQTKVLPEMLSDTYRKLKPLFDLLR